MINSDKMILNSKVRFYIFKTFILRNIDDRNRIRYKIHFSWRFDHGLFSTDYSIFLPTQPRLKIKKVITLVKICKKYSNSSSSMNAVYWSPTTTCHFPS